MINLFNYLDRPSPLHKLTGATKFVCLILYSVGAMITFDPRLIFCLAVFSYVLMGIAKIRYRDVSFVLNFTFIFMIFNNIVLFLFSPRYGTEIYTTTHVLLGSGHFALTAEQLFYHLNQILKCLCMVPAVLLFLCTTNPSEFASSLNKVGVPYSVAYSVSLALRYIPDIQREYYDISRAQQARGVEMSRKVNIFKRIKSAASILVPLIMSSMDKISLISNAMELRGFGKNKKRTWYTSRKFALGDWIAIAVCLLILAAALVHNAMNGGRFWNPFI